MIPEHARFRTVILMNPCIARLDRVAQCVPIAAEIVVRRYALHFAHDAAQRAALDVGAVRLHQPHAARREEGHQRPHVVKVNVLVVNGVKEVLRVHVEKISNLWR